MSDSEEEAAFASADEGEAAVTKEPMAAKKSASQSSKTTKEKKDKEGVGTGGVGDGKSMAASAGREGAAKGKGKQQLNKKKGKEPQQIARKDEKPKPVQASTVPESVSKEDSKESPGAKNLDTLVAKKPPAQTKEKNSSTQESKPATAAAKQPSKAKTANEGKTKGQPKPTEAKADQKAAAKQSAHDSGEVKQEDKSAETAAGETTEITKKAGDVRRGLQSDVTTPEGQDIPREPSDHTREQEEVLKKLGESAKENSGGWGWGNWGSSLLSAASNSVQTFTHQVGDGFNTIIESVESSLGVPDPEDIAKAQDVTEPIPTSEESTSEESPALPQAAEVKEAKKDKQESIVEQTKSSEETAEGKSEEKVNEDGNDEAAKKNTAESSSSWFASWGVADLAKKVQDTGKTLASKGTTLMSEGFDAMENLASGGIDVLENIGKKTYSTLTEHDPAFRKTREFLSPKSNKPNLSSVLRDARDRAELEAEQEKEMEEARKAHFGTLFDDYQGIAHLEALEMLSNQSEKKVHSLLNSLSSEDLANIKPTLISIKEAFEVKENEDETDVTTDQDFSSLVSQYLSELELGTAPDKLNKVHDMVKQWIVDFDSHDTHESDSVKEVHQKSIQALAELTSKGVEQFHKAGELVLLERDKDKNCTERAHSLARLTGVLCHEIGNMASKFSDCLNKMADEKENAEEVTPLVTNVYLEATNSSTYIQDAFQLLLPVLQQAALEHSILSRQS